MDFPYIDTCIPPLLIFQQAGEWRVLPKSAHLPGGWIKSKTLPPQPQLVLDSCHGMQGRKKRVRLCQDRRNRIIVRQTVYV